MGGSGSGTKTKTEYKYMPYQLDLIGLGAGKWQEQMRNWEPIGDIEDILGPEVSPYTTRALGQLTGLAAGGGYTPAEQLMAQVQGSRLASPGQIRPGEMLASSQAYTEASKEFARKAMEEEERKLGMAYGAKGKYGSGGHLQSLHDLYSGFGKSMSDIASKATQQAIESARTSSLQEDIERQKLADFMGRTYGGATQASRLGQLSQLGSLEREQALAELSRKWGMHESQVNDLLQMLGRGVGIATLSLPMEGTSRQFGGEVKYSGEGLGGMGGGKSSGAGGPATLGQFQSVYNPYTGYAYDPYGAGMWNMQTGQSYYPTT